MVDVKNFDETADYGNIMAAIGSKLTNLGVTGALLGRASAGGGGYESITLGNYLGLSGTSLNVTLGSSIGEANTMSNTGTGAGQIYKTKTGANLVVKTIKSGTGITITNGTDDITITAVTGGGGDVTGPGSATASGIVTFNSTTGKIIKDSGKTIVTTLGANDTTVPTSKAVKDVTDLKQKAITVSASEPGSPVLGDIWIQIA